MKSSIVDKDAVHAVVSLLLDAEAAVDGDDGASAAAPNGPVSPSSIRVIDAFLVPKLRYDSIKKLFYEYVVLSRWKKKTLILIFRGLSKIWLLESFALVRNFGKFDVILTDCSHIFSRIWD